jgi:hypothetical protein
MDFVGIGMAFEAMHGGRTALTVKNPQAADALLTGKNDWLVIFPAVTCLFKVYLSCGLGCFLNSAQLAGTGYSRQPKPITMGSNARDGRLKTWGKRRGKRTNPE